MSHNYKYPIHHVIIKNFPIWIYKRRFREHRGYPLAHTRGTKAEIKFSSSQMPKINKDFSDAIGFKSLTNFHDFTTEYPVEGAQIQKLYDVNFRETCFKCYPIIANAGIDPTKFVPKQADLKNELRKKFPVKVVENKKPVVIKDDDETESVYSEEILTCSVAIKPPQNSPPASPRASPKPNQKLAPKVKPAETQTPFPSSPLSIQCKRCAENLQSLQLKAIVVASLTRQNQNLTDQLTEKNKLFNQKTLEHIRLQNDYSMVKKELDALKNDKEFTSIMEYQRNKKRRL